VREGVKTVDNFGEVLALVEIDRLEVEDLSFEGQRRESGRKGG
jgi:hypothetical protein